MAYSSEDIDNINYRIKKILLACMPEPGIYPTSIDGFNTVRREDINRPENCFEKPLVGLVIQGTKISLMCGHEYEYTDNQSIVSTVDMPITSYVLNPSHEEPFLFLYLYLNMEMLSSLAFEMKGHFPVHENPVSSVSIADADKDLMEMFLRLLELNGKPEQISMRAPMMFRELHYVLLTGPHGNLLRQLHTPGIQTNQVAKAINWIRKNFRSPMRVEVLARLVGMSVASLHRSHFIILEKIWSFG